MRLSTDLWLVAQFQAYLDPPTALIVVLAFFDGNWRVLVGLEMWRLETAEQSAL